MIDYDAVFQAFIDVARDGIGGSLSTMGPNGSEFPSVIRSRQPGTTPRLPYAQVDITQIEKIDSFHIAQIADSVTGEVTYYTPYRLLMTYTIYDDPLGLIAQTLEAYLRESHVMYKLETDTAGGTLEQTFPIQIIPQKLATDRFLEVSNFSFIFSMTDVQTSTQDGVIRTVNIDGEIKKDVDDDTPLTFAATASSNP